MPAYVDRRVVDLDGAARAAAVAADEFGVETPALMRAGMNAIFRCGDVVLRVATPNAPARVSLELARTLGAAGRAVPLPWSNEVIDTDGFAVTAWPFVSSTSTPTDWRAVGTLVARVHQLAPGDLPAGLPTPSPLEFPWWDHETLLADVAALLDEPARDGLSAAIDRNAHWRGAVEADTVVCHGDVHPGNVITSQHGPVLVDWDLLCLAPAGWDHAPMMTGAQRGGGTRGVYRDMASGAGGPGRGDPAAEAFAELRLASATLMRLRVARAAPGAMDEAQRRLAFWRGDPDAPMWSAQ